MCDLICIAALERDTERIREILETGLNPNISDDKGNTALHFLASFPRTDFQEIENDLQMAGELIRLGADVNVTNHKLRTPLILAVRELNCRKVEFFLQANANINNRDNKGNSAIHYVFIFKSCAFHEETGNIKQLQILKTLLQYHPDLDVLNKKTQTPLMLAVSWDSLPLVQMLLKHNASVNIVNWQNESVLHHALRYNVNMDILEDLLRHGADFGLINEKGQTPMDIYINILSNDFSYETEKIKSVFKIYIFLQNTLSSSQQQEIEKISSNYNYQLLKFIENCSEELKKMLCDELAPSYYFHNVVLCAFLKRVKHINVPSHVSDKMLDKVIEGEYPVYCDLIVIGICERYLKKKFAEICSVGNTGREFLKFDVLYDLSFYLSQSDMLSMMVAFSTDSKWDIISHIWNTNSSRKTCL